MAKFEVDTEKPNKVSSTIVAKFLNLSDERVRQISSEGYLASEKKGRLIKFDLIPTVNTYIEYWKNRAKEADLNIDDEQRKLKADADWKEAKADIEKMKRDELRGSLHASADVEAVTSDLVMTIRAALLSLPGQLAVDVANAQTPAECSGIIKEAVNEVLNTLSQYQYDSNEYKKRVRERTQWMNAEGKEAKDEEE